MKTLLAARIAALILALGTAEAAHGAGTVRLLVALTWEGRDLREYNLAALRAFRQQLGDVSVVHFISPAYFLRGDGAASAEARIHAAVLPGDRVGLVVGGWRSLATEAKVIFRDAPTFWGETLRPVDCAADCGLDVPLSVYTEADAEKLVAAGVSVLERHGFGRVELMATEGFTATPELLRAAARAGIRYDFSAVAPEMIARRTARYPLFQWVKDLWGKVTPQSQPFAVDGVAGLTEIPQSLAAVDYWQPDEALQVFRTYGEMMQREPERDLLFPVGAYQETALKELPRLADALTAIRAEAAAKGITFRSAEFPVAAAVASTPEAPVAAVPTAALPPSPAPQEAPEPVVAH